MKIDEFIKSIDDKSPPPDLSRILNSLWWDKKAIGIQRFPEQSESLGDGIADYWYF